MDWNQIKTARRRLAREHGTVIKDWGGRLPIAVVYPNSYYLGMSNLGIHSLYRLFNSHPAVVAERVFWDNQTGGHPSLSIESQRPLSDFAVLAFSLSYELDYFNVVQLLNASGIPPSAADRNEGHPLVIAGGPCITANPMPLSAFIDAGFIGEAEAIIPCLLPVLMDGIGGSRHDLLQELARIPGGYVPRLPNGQPVVRQWVNNLDDFATTSVIITPDTELGDLYLIEVARGCNWNCRFCLVSNAFSPMRCRSVEQLVAQAETGLSFRRRLGLVGPAITAHPQIEELLTRFHQMGAAVSLSSLQLKPLSPGLLAAIAKGGAKTITLAPEAGSPRLRRLIGKGISEADILGTLEQIARIQVRQLKLYFMIGLPSETDDDIEAIIHLVLTGNDIVHRYNPGCRLVLNITPFVPKAGTPFQWLPMAPVSVLNQRLGRLRRRLQPKGIKVKSDSPAWSQVQGVLARGDARLGEVLANIEEVSLAGWRQAVASSQLDTDYYAHRQWDITTRLPWGMINLGTTAERLKSELAKALPIQA